MCASYKFRSIKTISCAYQEYSLPPPEKSVSLSSKLHRSLKEVPSANARLRLDISMHSLIISDQNHGGTQDVKMKAQLTGVHVMSDFSLSAGV